MLKKYKTQYKTDISFDDYDILSFIASRAAYYHAERLFTISVDSSGIIEAPQLFTGPDPGEVFCAAVFFMSSVASIKRARVLNITNFFLESCCEFLRVESFNPSHMEFIPQSQHQVPPKTQPVYDIPEMLGDIPLLVILTDDFFYKVDDRVTLGFPIMFGTRDGFPVSVVTGLSTDGVEENLDKMKLNKKELHFDIDDSLLYSAVLMLIKDVALPLNSITLDVPRAECVERDLSKFHSSTSGAPFTDYAVTIVTGGQITYSLKRPKKKSSLAYHYSLLSTRLYTKIYDSGILYDRVFPGANKADSSVKYEILNGHDESTKEDLMKLHKKIRHFYIDAMHLNHASKYVYKPLFDVLIMPGFEIGTKLNEGGFMAIFNRHSCGTYPSHLHGVHHPSIYIPHQDPAFKDLYEKYPILKDREYGETDASSFDQTLLWKMLSMVAIFFSMFYDCRSNYTRTLVGDAAFRLVFKYLYLKPMQSLYFVAGMMFSGKYETTTGNTAYQNLVFYLYVASKLEEHKYHPMLSLLKICIDVPLVVRSFSGDDFLFSYPKVLDDMFGFSLQSYVEFAGKVGITMKYVKKLPLLATVNSIKSKGVWITKLVEPGITFLKNMVAKVYEDDGCGEGLTLRGTFVYRRHVDLLFRVGNSDKANAYVDTFLAKVLSLAYLSFGNREVFNYLSVLYRLAVLKFQFKGFLDFEFLSQVSKGSGSMYSAYSSMIEDGGIFPDLETLRQRHSAHGTKPKRAFIPYNDYYGGFMTKKDLEVMDFDSIF